VRTVLHDPLHAEEVLLPEHQAAIGCVAVESARLEHLITVLIWSALSVETNIGKIITDNFATVSGKLDLLRDLSSPLFAEAMQKEFHTIYENITQILPRRNTVIHGHWEPMYSLADIASFATIAGIPIRKERTRVRQQARKSKTPRFEKATDVMAIALELHRCYSALYDFSRKYNLLATSPERVG